MSVKCFRLATVTLRQLRPVPTNGDIVSMDRQGQLLFERHSMITSTIPHPNNSPSHSSHPNHPTSSPPLLPSITPTLFQSKLKTQIPQILRPTDPTATIGLPSQTVDCSPVLFVGLVVRLSHCYTMIA